MTTTTELPDTAQAVRQITQGTQVRQLAGTVRAAAADDDDRAVSGIAVPFDDPIEIWGVREEFAPGSVTVLEDNPPQLFWRHREVIGPITAWADEDRGWQIASRVSDTALGRDALTLVRDGAIRRFSIGFTPIEWEEIHGEDDQGNRTLTIRHTKVLAREVSLVPHPAYEGAALDREHPTMTTTTKEDPVPDTTTTTRESAPPEADQAADLGQLRDDLDNLDRLVRSGALTPSAPAEHRDTFASFGHYVRALANVETTEADHQAALRAFQGATTGDTIVQDAWVGEMYRLMENRQRIMRLFRWTNDLPAEGMGVEYGVVLDNTVKVERQAEEGDDLAYGKVRIGTNRADVITAGGWTSLSRQAIERASVGHLEITFRAMALAYAKFSELNGRQVLDTAITDQAAAALDTGTTLGLMEYGDWITLLMDLAERTDDNNTALSGLLVSRDVFRAMADTDAQDKMLKLSAAPEGHAGELRITSQEAALNGLRVTYNTDWRAGTKVAAYDAEAIRTQEAPGAPFRLQDDSIVNLTRAFSLYGYLAQYVQVPTGIIPVTFGTGGGGDG